MTERRKKCFTLVETIISIFIFILAFGAVSALAINLYKTNSYSFQQSQAIWEARKGIEGMTKEIREVYQGDNGSFFLEEADDDEFIFYADVDGDGKTEKVRYFIAPAGGSEGSQSQECSRSTSGGSCFVTFSDFLNGELDTAEVKVSVDGDLNSGSEKIDIYADGNLLGTLCTGHECGQCKGSWQDLTTFEVTNEARDNSLTFTAQSSSSVNPICDGVSFKVKFDFSWKEKASSTEKYILKKGVIEPTGWPISYPSDNEKIYIISENVMNNARGEPLFTYYDKDGNLLSLPARLEKTTFMKFKIIINIDPNRPPQDFTLESGVQIRNLRNNQ